jgi:hypothetical protein
MAEYDFTCGNGRLIGCRKIKYTTVELLQDDRA